VLEQAPTWSTLRTIGQSRVLSLTILVPFVGYLILFNEHVLSLLTLWPELFGGADAIVGRLYFIYFGL
jgi:hypothetical protein